MANPRRTRAYRGGSRRKSGSGALVDTVRSTISQLTGNRNRDSRGGFISGLLSGGDNKSRSRGRRRR